MNTKKINKFLQSFIAIPMLAMAIPTAGIGQIPSTLAILDNNRDATVAASTITTLEDTIRQNKADAIDAYFDKYDAPLKGYGMKFVIEAENNNLDWRLLPAIAMRESTGGKHACKSVPNSVFGYGSCKLSFDSIDSSIEVVARSLGGNDPQTANHYDNKTTLQILKKYNSIIPGYSTQVVSIMKAIEDDGTKVI
jgi:hypothetical protein